MIKKLILYSVGIRREANLLHELESTFKVCVLLFSQGQSNLVN